MFESFVNAVQFSDSSHQHKIPQRDAMGCWHSRNRALPPISFIPDPASQSGRGAEWDPSVSPLRNGFLSCGLPEVWNSWLIIDFSKAGWEPVILQAYKDERSGWFYVIIHRDCPYVACKIWEFFSINNYILLSLAFLMLYWILENIV